MQSVILAAGKGTRMGTLTKDIPKSMLIVAGKPILEWKLEALPESIAEVVIVIGYLGENIKSAFGDTWNNKKITYVTQANPVGGTMDALSAARSVLRGTFLVMNGDDIHPKEDLERCIRHKWALAVSHTDALGASSSVITNEKGDITDIIEADAHEGGKGLAGVGAYVLDSRVFDVPPVTLTGRSEKGLPQTMLAASKKYRIPIAAVPVSFPLHFSTPEDIARGEAVLSRKK